MSLVYLFDFSKIGLFWRMSIFYMWPRAIIKDRASERYMRGMTKSHKLLNMRKNNILTKKKKLMWKGLG